MAKDKGPRRLIHCTTTASRLLQARLHLTGKVVLGEPRDWLAFVINPRRRMKSHRSYQINSGEFPLRRDAISQQ